MENTNLLNLPYIMANQAQKHVTHNEALRALDAIVQISVISTGTEDPPASPEEGDRYLLGETPTGAWEGEAGKLAVFVDGAWMFHLPQEGWLVWNKSQSAFLVFSAGHWEAAVSDIGPEAEIQDAAFVGINAQATQSERLVVQSGSTLFNHDGFGHQLKINKAMEQDTASLLFQSGYSGRAEFGLAGQDAFSMKVSEDGSNWIDAITINPADGRVEFGVSGLTVTADMFANLLPDSGRFNPTGQQSSITAALAQAPSYILPFNDALLKFPFRFIDDNTTYGGTRSPLNIVVRSLVETIFGIGGSRYGPEFWTMKIEGGAGTNDAISIDGQTYYRATIGQSGPRPAKYTTGFFVKCESGGLAITPPEGDLRKLNRNDEAAEYWTSDAAVSAADGWTYFEMQVSNPDRSADTSDMSIYLTAGGACYFALPRVIPGWVSIGKTQSVVLNDKFMG